MKSCFSTYLDNIEIDADVNVCIRVLQETEAIRRLCVCVCVCVCVHAHVHLFTVYCLNLAQEITEASGLRTSTWPAGPQIAASVVPIWRPQAQDMGRVEV